MIDDGGHFLQLDQPDVVARHIVDFVGQAALAHRNCGQIASQRKFAICEQSRATTSSARTLRAKIGSTRCGGRMVDDRREQLGSRERSHSSRSQPSIATLATASACCPGTSATTFRPHRRGCLRPRRSPCKPARGTRRGRDSCALEFLPHRVGVRQHERFGRAVCRLPAPGPNAPTEATLSTAPRPRSTMPGTNRQHRSTTAVTSTSIRRSSASGSILRPGPAWRARRC